VRRRRGIEGRRSAPRQSVGRGAGALLVARVLIAISGWAGSVVIARHLSPQAWGGYSFIFGLLGIIGLLVDLQVGRVVLREVLAGGDAAGPVVGSYVGLRLVVSTAAFVVAVAFVVIGDYETPVVWGTVIAGLGFLFVGPANGITVWFNARLWLVPTAVVGVTAAVVQLALVLAFALAGTDRLVLFASAALAAEVAYLGGTVAFMIRHGLRIRLRFDAGHWWIWMKESIPLAIGFGLVGLYNKLDIVMLSQLDSLTSVGRYSIGYKFADLASYLPAALLTPVLTLMVAAWPHDEAGLRRHFRQSFVLLFVGAVAVGLGFALVAFHAIDLLYGSEYVTSADAARWLVAGACLQFFSLLCVVTLISVGRNALYAIAGVCGLALNAGLNLVLIPSFSFNGSAVATVITEVAVAALLLVTLARKPGVVTLPWNLMARTALAGIIMTAIYLGVDWLAPWPAAALVAVAGFLGALHLLHCGGPGGLPALLRNARFEHDLDGSPPAAWAGTGPMEHYTPNPSDL
jgi:O-antigen/teichoic acid export membrane protein